MALVVIRVLLLASLVVACGDDARSSPDAQLVDDSADEPDGPPTPTGCDYAELADETNDDVTEDGEPELTGETLTAAAGKVLCGTVSPDHFNDADDTVDVDSFAVQLPAGPVIVTLSGAGLEALGEAKLGVYSGKDFTTIEAEEPLVGSHAVVMLDLPSGAYEFSLLAENGTAITAALSYKIKVSVDTPAVRCPKLTSAALHTESATNNDVVSISYASGTSMTLTAATTDAPETTNVTVLQPFDARISGAIAASGQVGDYKDPDTYAFTTGVSTDSLTIRLNWAGAADLDWFLFRANQVPAVASSANSDTSGDEMRTVSVLPNTTYWLFTGMYKTSTAPMAYDLSMCGATFVAP